MIQLIPAPQDCQETGRPTTLSPTTVIRCDSGSRASGRLLALEIGEQCGWEISVEGLDGPVRDGPVRDGDIVLRTPIGPPPGLGAGGYVLSSDGHVTIEGADAAGTHHGGRTLLQLLRQPGAPVAQLPGVRIRDWPGKPERGVMIDCGRRFLGVESLRRLVQRMSRLKLNYLHLHLSDNQGFRIESVRHPEVVTHPALSQQDLRELLDLAAEHHITVVPEIDMPGHLAPVLAAHPHLRLRGRDGRLVPDYIDLSLDEAHALCHDLLDELIALFPGPYWHIGADEYVEDYAAYPQLAERARASLGETARGRDLYYSFINDLNARVRSHGKTTRLWNDGIKDVPTVVTVDRSMVVDYWEDSTGAAPAQWLLDRGHRLMNHDGSQTYDVPGVWDCRPEPLYENWDADLFRSGQRLSDPNANSGAVVHLWNDIPDALPEAELWSRLHPLMAVMAQQTWASPPLVATYAEFSRIISALTDPPT